MRKVFIESQLLWLAMLIDVLGDDRPTKRQSNTIAYNIILSIYEEIEGL